MNRLKPDDCDVRVDVQKTHLTVEGKLAFLEAFIYENFTLDEDGGVRFGYQEDRNVCEYVSEITANYLRSLANAD